MRHLLCALMSACLLLLAWSGIAIAHPGYYNTAFHAHDVEEARALAEREHKQIFVAVTTPERDGWPVFRWPDATNQALVDLLVRETVIVELDTVRSARELPWREHHGEALLLLGSNGELRRELPVDAPPRALLRTLERDFSSDAAIDRIARAIEDLGEDHFVSRERLAHALHAAGRHDEALAEFRWCSEAAIEARSRAAEARRPYVWTGLARLARESDDAEALLASSRAVATERVVAAPEERKLAHDLGRLNAMLGESAANAALFDRLPRTARARHSLVDSLLGELVEARRYDEVLLLVHPVQAWQGEVEIYRRNRIRRPASAERGRGRGTRNFVVERGLALVEALAGEGDRARSLELHRALLEFENSPRVRGGLRDAGARSGRMDLLSPDRSSDPRAPDSPGEPTDEGAAR
jgi:hypothetical protein